MQFAPLNICKQVVFVLCQHWSFKAQVSSVAPEELQGFHVYFKSYK